MNASSLHHLSHPATSSSFSSFATLNVGRVGVNREAGWGAGVWEERGGMRRSMKESAVYG